MSIRTWIGSAVLVGQLAIAPASPFAAELFVDTTEQGTLDLSETEFTRSRFVEVDASLLLSGPSQIDLNLFPDVTVTADLVHSASSSSDAASWTGREVGTAHTGVFLVWRDGALSGAVIREESQFDILYAGNGVHAVLERDPADMGDDVEVPPEEMTCTPNPPEGSEVDVAFLYPSNLASVHPLGAIEAKAIQTNNLINTALAASQVNMSVRLEAIS